MSTPHPIWNAQFESAYQRLLERVIRTHEQVGQAWPYHADPHTGRWETTDDGDWCGGHWVECLRIAAEGSGDARLLQAAAERTERLRPYLERDDQFRGHRFYYSAARQYGLTGESKWRTLALAAAYAMRSMAMEANGAMPIGTQVQVKSTTLASRAIVAVDNVHPNLQLDWWARREVGDPVFEQGARRHLDTTERDFLRADGSTVEFIEYHPGTGRPAREFTLLGAHDHSCWSRGQAWAIAGYLRAWEETGDARYEAVADRLYAYWQAHAGPGGVPPWDFMDPLWPSRPQDVPLDTSASAIVVEQLARLAVGRPELSLPGLSGTPWLKALVTMLEGLMRHLSDEEQAPVGRLIDGCFNQPRRFAWRSELLWGTAYLLFALHWLRTGHAPA